MGTLKRRRILFFTGLSLLSLAILAATLNGIQLHPGQPFPFFATGGDSGLSGNLPGGQIFLLIMRWIYLIALLILPLSLIYLILSPYARKQFLRELRRFLPFLIILFAIALFFKNLPQRARVPEVQQGGASNQPYLTPVEPVQGFVDQLPAWLVITTSLLVSLVLIGIVFLLVRSFRRQQNLPEKQLLEIGEQAQQAVEELKQGGDLKNVVIRCYFQMNKLLSQQRGIFREEAMTPREFVQTLEEKGLPRDPVRRLTQLFEAARYGLAMPGESEEAQAIASLTAIADYCREAA